MSLPEVLLSFLSDNGGFVTTEEASSLGFSNERMRLFVRAGELESVGHGIYMGADYFLDKMYVTQKACQKVIYSHETALFLHALTDRDPINYNVTVPQGYHNKRLLNDGFSVYAIKADLHLLNVIEMKTAFGNKIRAYDLERTVCDCVRRRNHMDIAVLTDALKFYVQRKDKNLIRLMESAKQLRVEKKMKEYMEVLL